MVMEPSVINFKVLVLLHSPTRVRIVVFKVALLKAFVASFGVGVFRGVEQSAAQEFEVPCISYAPQHQTKDAPKIKSCI